MWVVYVAGPFRAETAWEIAENVRAAERVGLEVARFGAMPLIPHSNTQHFQGQGSDEFWIEGTRELLKRCDAMVLVPCFEGSAGTLGEIETAHEMGIPIFHSVAELAAAAPPNARVVVPQEISKEDRP